MSTTIATKRLTNFLRKFSNVTEEEARAAVSDIVEISKREDKEPEYVRSFDKKLHSQEMNMVIGFGEVNTTLAETDTKIEKRFAEFEAKMEKRFAEAEKRSVELEAKMDLGFANLNTQLAQIQATISDSQKKQFYWLIGLLVTLFLAILALILK